VLAPYPEGKIIQNLKQVKIILLIKYMTIMIIALFFDDFFRKVFKDRNKDLFL